MDPEGIERHSESSAAREGIIQTATRLFASLSYDGTSLQMIADCAGLDIANVTALVGNKRDLYLTVMERVSLTTRAAYDSILGETTPDRAGLHHLINRSLDFSLEHPEVPTLWIHRWLGDAADVLGLEARYLVPLLAEVNDILRKFVPTNVDTTMAMGTIIWCVRGFVLGGPPDMWDHPERPRKPAVIQKFRAHLLWTADYMLLHICS